MRLKLLHKLKKLKWLYSKPVVAGILGIAALTNTALAASAPAKINYTKKVLAKSFHSFAGK